MTTPSAPALPDMGTSVEPPLPPVLRHRGIVRLTHWLNAVFLTGMIASGLQIYAAYAHFGIRGSVLNLPNPFDASRMAIPPEMRLGGWLAGGLRWHFTLAWPFVLTGLAYAIFLAVSGEWRKLIFRPRDVPGAIQMTRYYLRLRPDHPEQGKHNPLQKSAYSFIILLAVISTLSGFAIAKPIQLSLLTSLFGGYQLARYWHFVTVWTFIAFTIVHVVMVFVADPASMRAILTGRYRGRFPNG
ncbi:MAG: cytochrome b/b6 domain-containing protein [Gemmatimonadales bacterium]|nr:cytochrome b/b6 domain-containing protein [Gemmatimonadales bacterium]